MYENLYPGSLISVEGMNKAKFDSLPQTTSFKIDDIYMHKYELKYLAETRDEAEKIVLCEKLELVDRIEASNFVIVYHHIHKGITISNFFIYGDENTFSEALEFIECMGGTPGVINNNKYSVYGQLVVEAAWEAEIPILNLIKDGEELSYWVDANNHVSVKRGYLNSDIKRADILEYMFSVNEEEE